MADASKKGKPAPVREVMTRDGAGILEELVASFRPVDESSRQRAESLVAALLRELVDPSMVVVPGASKAIQARIAAIDAVLSRQVNAIIHHPEFQRLEAAWRGLAQLVMNSETGDSLRIRVFNVSKRELLRDFQSAAEFTESALWKKIYESEYNQAGGEPYGVLVGDFEFSRHPEDVELLTHISKVAAAAHAPFISAAGSEMFGLESFADLAQPRDLKKIFDRNSPENTRWLSFRQTDESRFVVLTAPRVLARLPYGKDTARVDGFDFEESADGSDHDSYLWSNAAYALADRLTDAFSRHHWCVAIRGLEGGGRVSELPVATFRNREGDVGAKCPTEVLISDSRENELAEMGFLPLVHYKNTDYAVFVGNSTTHMPEIYKDPADTANADLSSRLPYLMAVSRIAHYMKVICRDRIGTFASREEVETFLGRWIKSYVLDQDNATQEQKAKYPLRMASVEVVEDPAHPGRYRAVALLRPHFQIDALDVSLRLVADLPKQAT